MIRELARLPVQDHPDRRRIDQMQRAIMWGELRRTGEP
jgi:hypothetical protein